MKEITLTETDDELRSPPDGNIILTRNGALVMSIETLMRATDNVVQITGLRNVLSGRKRRKGSGDKTDEGKT